MIRNWHTIKNDLDQDIVGLSERPSQQLQNHVVVLCHWRSVDKDELGVFTTLSDELIQAWHDVFRFDFRWSGQSDWTDLDMTVTSEKEDVLTVCLYLSDLWYKSVTLLAASFAWGPVVLAWEHISWIEKKWLILRNAMTEYTLRREKIKTDDYRIPLETQWYIERSSRKFRASKACFDEVKVLEPHLKLAEIDSPIVIIHWTEDIHIPHEDAVRHAQKYWIQLVTIQWGKHGFHNPEKRAAAMNAAVRFVNDNL